jgi:ClpX C4-type zinc finger
MKKIWGDDSLRCSFCKKGQNNVGKLISSPSNYPRAYICDECVAICVAIIEDDKLDAQQAEAHQKGEEVTQPLPLHPLLDHPLASGLIDAIEEWIREESLGNDGLVALCHLREVASRMLAEKR